ncbi:MAG TPA: hypothetical protein VJJ82_01030 [Candidatus Nanoarchaeia archaeon]|nr:hypothetical protein [Candidatus Nanoarchaeia archaeon]
MRQNHALAVFAIVVLLAIGAFWYLWSTQINYGRTIEGARSLGESMLRRDALVAQRPSGELLKFKATTGCCNYLERPSMGSQLMIDVAPGNGNCYDDELTQKRVKAGFIIVDIEPQPCSKSIVV